jgi:hypothetical protein
MTTLTMNSERYKDLMLRFAKEIHEVGVNENMIKIVHAQVDRTPNIVSCGTEDVVRKFYYQYDGYMIEAVQTVKITLKTCA